MVIYSGFSPKKIVIFHSYVKLPEGIWDYTCGCLMLLTVVFGWNDI